ncbi:hypothetical protein ACROYT_G037265 [Oculina patagonica]
MKYFVLVAVALIFCFLHGALGIICKKCTPDAGSLKACDKPEQLTEVNCDNEPFPFNVTNGTKYDSCATSTIEVTLSGTIKLTSFVMSCGVKVNSSNPSVVNCSIVEDYVCGDARRRAASDNRYSINTCSTVCCLEKTCNALPTPEPNENNANGDTSTAASTTAGNGVSEVQPSCLGMLLVLLAMSVLMKKAA